MDFFQNDFLRALQNPLASTALTLRNVKSSYRRSYLGALWISLTVAITITALAGVYTYLFPITLSEYMPYLTVSYVGWIAISNMLLSGPNVFIQYSSLIQQETSPYTHYVIAVIADKLLIFFNHCIVILIVLIIFQVPITWTFLAFPVAVALLFISGIGMCFVFGVIATRFRDVNQILTSLVQLAFFVTPVLWKPEFLAGRTFIVDFNPFFHYLAILREPLLDGTIPWVSFGVTAAFAAGSMLIGIATMTRYKRWIVFWI